MPNVTLPFPKGKTRWEGEVPTSGANYGICGQEYHYSDDDTGFKGTLRVVRNESGITLFGKQPVQLNTQGTSITGYAASNVSEWVVLDDDLASGGVEDDDMCYVVIRGCPIVKTAASSLLAISAGSRVVAGTQSNSTAAGTTAAGVNLIPAIANATDAAGALANNRGVMAKALTAATTNETSTEIRVRIDARLV